MGIAQDLPIVKTILSDESSFYYTNFKQYPLLEPNMPIGVFDSGTGGLTVMNAIVTLDLYNNKTHEKRADGIPDFSSEDFIYLADQANMPYGNYAAMHKTDLLQEHIIKDAQFLLGTKYYNNNELYTNKKQIKVLVVACNTATAYGLSDIEQFLAKRSAGYFQKIRKWQYWSFCNRWNSGFKWIHKCITKVDYF